MILKVVNTNEEGVTELIEFSPNRLYSELIEMIADTAIILKPLETTDEDGNFLWDRDILKFTYEKKKYIGYLAYEECMWIIKCEKLIDEYIEVKEILESDGGSHWIKGKKIGNKFTEPLLLKNKRNQF